MDATAIIFLFGAKNVTENRTYDHNGAGDGEEAKSVNSERL